MTWQGRIFRLICLIDLKLKGKLFVSHFKNTKSWGNKYYKAEINKQGNIFSLSLKLNWNWKVT